MRWGLVEDSKLKTKLEDAKACMGSRHLRVDGAGENRTELTTRRDGTRFL